MTLVLTIARAVAPLAMGLLYTWTGGYTAVFSLLILIAAASVGAILAAPQVPCMKSAFDHHPRV